MSAKPLPPSRPPGVLDLLAADAEATPGEATPRAPDSDPSWRADALGRSRHSRLASEVREPLDDSDPNRAERICAEVTRDALGDLAPALLLLSAKRRRRTQALTAWTVGLFDLALRPGLAGLDGDRLAQINAWEFRTEEALDGSPAGQPVFVALASEQSKSPWPREAMDEIAVTARRTALSARGRDQRAGDPAEDKDWQRAHELGDALIAALLGTEASAQAGSDALAQLLGLAMVQGRSKSGDPTPALPPNWGKALRALRIADAPAGWRRAASYVRRALDAKSKPGSSISEQGLGLAARLRLLTGSILWPR